jgi:hypothetical protein
MNTKTKMKMVGETRCLEIFKMTHRESTAIAAIKVQFPMAQTHLSEPSAANTMFFVWSF